MLNFSTQKTMRIAQQLYEGVDVKGQWNCWSDHLSAYGFHPYFRRSRCSSKSLCRRKLRRRICCCRRSRQKKSGKKIQDAHEAIRPTDITRTPVAGKRISHKRSVPSVSADLETFCRKPYGKCAVYDTTSVKDRCRRIPVSMCPPPRLAFDGFMSVYVAG